jgi:hypothetical protein
MESYEKLRMTRKLMSLPVSDIGHAVNEINKQRFVVWSMKNTANKIKIQRMKKLLA